MSNKEENKVQHVVVKRVAGSNKRVTPYSHQEFIDYKEMLERWRVVYVG